MIKRQYKRTYLGCICAAEVEAILRSHIGTLNVYDVAAKLELVHFGGRALFPDEMDALVDRVEDLCLRLTTVRQGTRLKVEGNRKGVSGSARYFYHKWG